MPFIVPKNVMLECWHFGGVKWPFCLRIRFCQRKNGLSVVGSNGAMGSDMVVGQLVGVGHCPVKKHLHLSSQASAGCTRSRPPSIMKCAPMRVRVCVCVCVCVCVVQLRRLRTCHVFGCFKWVIREYTYLCNFCWV